MITLQKIVQQWLEKKERQNKYSRCFIYTKKQTALQTLVKDTYVIVLIM